MTPHFATYEESRKIVVTYGGQPVLIAEKPWQLIQLAECYKTGLVLPVEPEPVTVHNQRWLLKLASEALAMAAEGWGD